MDKNRVFPRQRQARWFMDYRAAARTAYKLYETAWTDAWPHLDDWFKTDALRHEGYAR